jgi:glycosyltransferase involved in cell wall biosynthesis
MRICYIADARSPIARNWIAHFIEAGHDVHVIASFPCPADALPGATLHQIPIAFASLYQQGGTAAAPARSPSVTTRLFARIKDIPLGSPLRRAHDLLAPIELSWHVGKARRRIAGIAPDLIHAMRIPYEGMLAALAAPPGAPVLISTWGNDLTMYAQRNPLLAWRTRQALRRADALHCDCARDLELAIEGWGYDAGRPAEVMPGAGGVQSEVFHPGPADDALRRRLAIPDGAPVLINPRGLRPYVRNDVLFKALPEVVKAYPQAVVLCSSMAGSGMVEGWVERYGLARNVRLLAPVTRDEMAQMFRLAQITVSPSNHDGTPNTLLEAMACGCFPVAGDIASVREWIRDGENGLLCDPNDTAAVAQTLIRALHDEPLRARAHAANRSLILERADHTSVMRRADLFYERIVALNRDRAAGPAVQAKAPR